MKKALVALGKRPQDAVLVSGIGQAAKLPHYLNCHVFNGLHGRALPAAQAIKIANRALTVIALGGDGDMYGEGGNHFLHALRRNLDLTLLVHDNKVYGLTKGQASPTTDLGIKTKVQPDGVINYPLNPLALAISQQASFVARAFSGSVDHLAQLIQAGVENPGFSYIEILQPCVSFNKVNTHAWYKERIYDVQAQGGYDPRNWHAALDKSQEWGEKIPVGIIYQTKRTPYALAEKPLVDLPLAPQAIGPLLKKYYQL